ncbi:thioredoxin family protein [Megalodesulfovibrio paquesii]
MIRVNAVRVWCSILVAATVAACAVSAWAGTSPFAVRGKVTLVDFSAVWCGPCRIQKPILQDLAKELGDRVAVVYVDVDKDRRAQALGISAIPTLVFYDASGAIRHRFSGVMPREAILATLEQIGLPPAKTSTKAPAARPSPQKQSLTLD